MKLLCPSMMCANFVNLEEEIRELERANIDIFHCDIMDGTFVPNFTMGINDIKAISSNTEKMVDCHLMIENPGTKVDLFIDAGVDLIYIHPESERYVSKTIKHIKSRDVLAGIAINPDTSIDMIIELLHLVDYVLVMTVNPGFAGQEFIDSTKIKIKKLIDLRDDYHYKIIIDGACSPEIIKELDHLGCDGYILGTSALFGKKKGYQELIERLHNL